MRGDRDELIEQFCEATGSFDATTTLRVLEAEKWHIENAVDLFYALLDYDEHSNTEDAMDVDDPSRGDDAGDASQSGSSSRPTRQPQNQSRMRTLKDIQGGSAGDDSDSEDENKQDFFAGGEKSALAVQNPNNNNNGNSSDHFNNIINQARQNRPRPGGDETPPTSSNFAGRAQTLGGDDAPSRLIGEPQDDVPSQQRTALPRVTRTLHLWQDGFSVDDGPLYRFDDPENAPTLALINQGRAPLALLGVEPGQEVDLQLNPHKDENFVQPKKKYKAFEGSGQRLGSPTPGPSAVATPPPAATTSGTTSSASANPASSVNVDDSQPTITLQIRLGDGTRLQSRFNTSHTIGDVYDFVNAASPASTARSYALMTTFPSKELSDKSIKLEDMPEFKRGGVVVQKWN